MAGVMKVICSSLCVVLLFLCLVSPAVTLDRPGIHPFPDVTIGEAIKLRPVADGVFVESSPGVRAGDLVACMRVRIHGISRLNNLKKFAVVTRVRVQAAESTVYRISVPKVEVCVHRNGSMEVAQCAKDNWRPLEKGSWSGVASPFETKYIDIRTTESHTDVALSISAEEESQPYRYAFLAVGMLFLLVAPEVSAWVPFYYGSAMTLGVFLVILILLYQGMKLLPTGRKSSLYLLLYGSLLGLGTVVMHYLTGLVSTLLHELGLGDDMFNPVAVFLCLGVGLVGAWLGYWGVRKMVLSEDGQRIDSGVELFVKWAIRIVGGAMLLQSSYDGVFSVLLLAMGSGIVWLMRKLYQEIPNFLEFQWPEFSNSEGVLVRAGEKWEQLWSKQTSGSLHSSQRFPKKMTKQQADALQNLPGKDALMRSEQISALSKKNSPVPKVLDGMSTPRAYISTPPRRTTPTQTTPTASSFREFYSSFHKTPGRKPLSSTDYKTTDITSTEMDKLVKTKEWQQWWAKDGVNRVSIAPNEHRQERPEHEIEATASMPQDEDFFLGKSSDHIRRFPGRT